MPEMDQAVIGLIPQPERNRFHAARQIYRFYLKDLILLMTLFQLVIGYPRAEMVDVVKADIA